MRLSHITYYIIEAAVLGLGFLLVARYSYNFQLQLSLLVVLLLVYSILGIFHHARSHDIHPRIVLEYVLISLFIMSIFLFLKGGLI